MDQPKPAEILFGAYRRQVLALLLLRPDERFHVRGIARLTGIPAGSLHRELTLLAQAELLLRQKEGRQVYYQANRQSPIFAELAGIFRKTAGLADVIRAALLPLADQIELAFVFGSVAQGKERSNSDIDLFVVGEVSFTAIVAALADLHERLGREINPVIMRSDEFSEKCGSDPFLQRITKETKIYVMGGADDFAKLVGDWTVKGT
ncbi:MAG: nucleotidyltransferase domain-containing protein [Desulfuromonadales bacterium]|nr:nucleotidyltransferase domain-containing protein [Desulfuromonadales bacterium]